MRYWSQNCWGNKTALCSGAFDSWDSSQPVGSTDAGDQNGGGGGRQGHTLARLCFKEGPTAPAGCMVTCSHQLPQDLPPALRAASAKEQKDPKYCLSWDCPQQVAGPSGQRMMGKKAWTLLPTPGQLWRAALAPEFLARWAKVQSDLPCTWTPSSPQSCFLSQVLVPKKYHVL